MQKLTLKTLDAFVSQYETIAITANERVLACGLEEALEAHPARDATPVYEEVYSLRLFFSKPRPGSPHLMNEGAVYLADQLMLLARTEARYSPPNQQRAQKGWKVEKIIFEGHPAALVRAMWVA